MHLVGHEPITSPPVPFLLGEEVPLELELIGKYKMMIMMDGKTLDLSKKKLLKIIRAYYWFITKHPSSYYCNSSNIRY